MKNRGKILLCLLFAGIILISNSLKAQVGSGQGCPQVQIFKQLSGNDTTELSVFDRNHGIQLTCDTLYKILFPISFAPGLPADGVEYVYERIPYNPPASFTTGWEVQLPTDDCWSQPFNFNYGRDVNDPNPPFQFCFYYDPILESNNKYTDLVVSSNGIISFDYQQHCSDPDNTVDDRQSFPQSVSNHCAYTKLDVVPHSNIAGNRQVAYKGYQVWPDTTFIGSGRNEHKILLNSIFFPYQDVNFNIGGHMRCSIEGEYPCRKAVVVFDAVPMYNCSSMLASYMCVLYETSNVIEFYLKDKPNCTSWEAGRSSLGIQNKYGDHALTITNDRYAPTGGTPTVKSYNCTAWEAHNEAWRIRPSEDLPDVTVQWSKRPTMGPNAGNEINVSGSEMLDANRLLIKAQPTKTDGPTWYITTMTIISLEENTIVLKDSVLVRPLDVPDLFLSHNGLNEFNLATNTDSTEFRDTICAGDPLRFNLAGGDRYYFVEPAELVSTQINGNSNFASVTVNQPVLEDSVFYVFKYENWHGDTLICTRYDSCVIYNRTYSVNVGQDITICKNEEVTFTDELNGTQGSCVWTYADQTVGTNDTITFKPQQTSDLKLTKTDRMGCVSTDDARITVNNAPDISITGTNHICNGTITQLTVNSSVGGCIYAWDNGMTIPVLDVKPNETTTYRVSVKLPPAMCETIDSITVTVVPIPDISVNQDQTICSGDNATITVFGEADRFRWQSFDESVNNGEFKQYVVSPENTTKYTVSAFNDPILNCTSSASTTVSVEHKPSPIITFRPEIVDELSPMVVFADSTDGVMSRQWYVSDGSTSEDKIFIHNFEIDDTTQIYKVTLTAMTPAGCTDSTSASLRVRREHHLYAPTGVYLHDSNPANNSFRLYIDNVNDFKLKIYNRWGTLMFESDDPVQVWDCTYKNEKVQQGVYSWIVDYSHRDHPERTIRKSGTVFIYN